MEWPGLFEVLEGLKGVVAALVQAGIERDRVVFLPSRGVPGETPTPEEVAWVATGQRSKGPPFMSMSCLRSCAKSERFVSIGADRTVAYCSYTVARRKLAGLSHRDIVHALGIDASALGLIPCDVALVRPR